MIEPIAERVSSALADLPGASLLPTPTPVDPAKGVEFFFGFAEKALELQKNYLLRLSALPSSTSAPAAPVKKAAASTAKQNRALGPPWLESLTLGSVIRPPARLVRYIS